MPTRRKEETTKINLWLADSQTQAQQDPYDAEADDMAPSHSVDGSAEGHSRQCAAENWQGFLISVSRRLSASSTKRRHEALLDIEKAVRNPGKFDCIGHADSAKGR